MITTELHVFTPGAYSYSYLKYTYSLGLDSDEKQGLKIRNKIRIQ